MPKFLCAAGLWFLVVLPVVAQEQRSAQQNPVFAFTGDAQENAAAALQKLESGAKAVRSGGWSTTIPNRTVLRDTYLVYVRNLRSAAALLQGDSRLSRGENWAEELMELFGQHRLPESLNSLLSDAILDKSKLEEFAGKETMHSANTNLDPAPELRLHALPTPRTHSTTGKKQGRFHQALYSWWTARIVEVASGASFSGPRP
jgi:hypothetical protein